MNTVRYYPEDHAFVFNSSQVPAEHFVSYSYDTPMFAFLNSHLLPTDILGVFVDYNHSNGATVCIVYDLDDEILLEMPFFTPIDFDGDPF